MCMESPPQGTPSPPFSVCKSLIYSDLILSLLYKVQVLVGVRVGLSIAHAQVWATTLGWLKGSFSTA